eukprot:3737799-Ditylum_brightwellii.AAC.1
MEKKTRINQCINMITFGMKTTLVRFQDQYYNYKGAVDWDKTETNEDDNWLANGAYELAFCTDIHTYKMCNKIYTKLKQQNAMPDDHLAP